MPKNVNALDQFESGAWSSIMQSFNPVTKDFPTTSLTSEGTGNGISAGKHLPRINKEFCDDDGQPLPTLNYYDENQVGQTIIGNDDLDTQIEKQDVAAPSRSLNWQDLSNLPVLGEPTATADREPGQKDVETRAREKSTETRTGRKMCRDMQRQWKGEEPRDRDKDKRG